MKAVRLTSILHHLPPTAILTSAHYTWIIGAKTVGQALTYSMDGPMLLVHARVQADGRIIIHQATPAAEHVATIQL
jgi:hypothetical protein